MQTATRTDVTTTFGRTPQQPGGAATSDTTVRAAAAPGLAPPGPAPAPVPRLDGAVDADSEALARTLLLAGLSVPAAAGIMARMVGRQAVSVDAVARDLDAEINRAHARPFARAIRYLLLDSVPVWIGPEAAIGNKQVLCAYAVTPEGDHGLIDFRFAERETIASWTAFLNSLRRRGLDLDALQLVTTDGSGAVSAALDVAWPDVRRQHSWNDNILHVRLLVPPPEQAGCVEGLLDVLLASGKHDAIMTYISWARRWRDLAPVAIDYVERHIDELLAFHHCPAADHVLIRNTDPIHRALLAVRARPNPMVSFEHTASCRRVLHGIVAIAAEATPPAALARARRTAPAPATRRARRPALLHSIPPSGDDGSGDPPPEPSFPFAARLPGGRQTPVDLPAARAAIGQPPDTAATRLAA
ncbi:MAG: transposase [Dehalococcoidia bacterium]